MPGNERQGDHETLARSGRARMTPGRRIAIAAAAVAGAFVVYEIAASFVAYTADAYVQSDLVAVAPQVTGRIVAVSVADNQTVSQGDLLAAIDPVPFQLTADQRRAELAEARAQVAADEDGVASAQVAADEDGVASAQAAVTAARAAATYAHETRARAAVLVTGGDVSRADLQKTDDDQRQADAAVEARQAALAGAQATSAMHRAAQDRAVAALAAIEWQLARTQLVAPVSGTVTALTLRPGDTAQTDVPLIGIVDGHAWRIVANYKQSFIRGFRPGDTAWVWLDSQPWQLHRARVAGVARGISREPSPDRLLPYVAPTTDWIRLQRRFPVTLTLVDPAPSLTLFMGADARVLILP
jgi:multidrug efflux system membrane fusion protein